MTKRPSQKIVKDDEETEFVVRLESGDVRENVTVDEFIGMQEGLMRPTRDALARFIYRKGTGEKLPPEQALKEIGSLSLADMDALVQEFREGVMEIAVPKVKSGV